MPFPYFGRKKRLAPKYPSPLYDRIIEPFAGSAGYSIALDHWERQVILVENNPDVVRLWRWLINPDTTPNTIMDLPVLEHKASLDPLGPRGTPQRMLVESVGASKDPRYNTMSGWMARDWPQIQKRVAADIHKIKHWVILEGDYSKIINMKATWFIDPPYQRMLKEYQSTPYALNGSINFDALGVWCRERSGQVIVCEELGATWLPFQPLTEAKTISNQKIVEAVWLNDPKWKGSVLSQPK